MRRFRRLTCLVAISGLVALAAPGTSAEEPSGSSATLYEKAVDLVVVRPLGLVPILVAPVGCLLGLPVAWVMQSPVDPLEICLEDPVAYTFQRPLGEF